MQLEKITVVLSFIGALFVCAGCTTVAPQTGHELPVRISAGPDLKSEYATLQQRGGKVFALNPQASSVRIYAFSGGKAPGLGHPHVLSAPQFTGFFYLPPDGTRKAKFDLEFVLRELEIDNPQYRSALGGAFAKPVSPDDIAGTREHMLGEKNLQAAQFPLVRIHSLQIIGEAPKFAASIRIEMHGATREIWVPLNVEGLPDRLAVSGSFVLRQSDFGVVPYTVLNGLLAVEDAFVVEFQLNGKQLDNVR
jgi:polyisoprenoid-binding protein YceI